MTMSEKLTAIAENVPKVYEAGQKSMVDESKIIEKTVTGSAISLDDVSEVPHEVSVQLSRHTGNLFDKNNGIIIDGYVGDTISVAAGSFKTVAIPCTPNTTYTVHKTVGERFIVGTTTVYPAQGVAVYDRINDYKAESITITTGADAKYLVAYVWNVSNDTGITADAMVDSVQIHVNNIADFSGVTVNVARNYFNVNLINPTANIINNGNGSFTISGIYAANTLKTLHQLAPELVVGDMVTLSAESNAENKASNQVLNRIYLSGAEYTWYFEQSVEITQALLDSRVMFYGTKEADGTLTDAYIKNIVMYKDGGMVSYTPVDGIAIVKSRSPLMNIYTDTLGIDITATYHKSWGMQTEYDKFWDAYQQNGSLTDYSFAFGGKSVNDDWYNPKYPIIATSNTNTFRNCAITDTKVDIDVRGSNGTYVFNNAEKLVTVRKLIVDEITVYTGWFAYCSALVEIRFEGVIGQSLDIHWSKKLSAESLNNIVTHTSTTATITLTLPTTAEATYNAKYGSGAWATLIATRSNVTFAYA